MKSFLKSFALAAIAVFALSLPAASTAHAQELQNLYLAGASYNNAGTPAVAGTALYAHVVPNTSTYAFTLIDVLPTAAKPLTVTTNIGVGVAQKVLTIAGYNVLVPASVGISYSGTNTGWAWTTGAAVPIKLKASADGGSWMLMPTVRVAKSSVSGGTGYQPIFGVLVGWGK